MPILSNSQRHINTATYVQIRRDDSKADKDSSNKVKRALEKVNFLRSLAIGETEIPGLFDLLDEIKDNHRKEKLTFLLELAAKLAADSGAGSNLRYAPLLKDISLETLEDFGRFLVEARHKFKTEAKTIIEDIRTTYTDKLNLDSSPGLVAMGEDLTYDAPFIDNQPQFSEPIRKETTSRRTIKEDDASTKLPRKESVRLGMAESLPAETEKLSSSKTNESSTSPTKPIQNHQPNLKEVLAWAVAKDDERIKELTKRGVALKLDNKWSIPANTGASDTYAAPEIQWNVSKHPDHTEAAIDEFVQRMKIEPVGRLHLERLTMTPAGIERGELQYSVPLAPKETVNISHKEWSTKSEEFEKIVQDVFEEYSEEGVAEKKELAQSTDSQQRRASAYSLSGNYSYAGSASIAFGYNSSSEDQKSQKDSLKKNSDITKKSSSRSKKDHKHSFKVESAAGSEDQSIRIISNPSETEAMRVDYYQLMRKWRVDLFRHDLRMTYDIVIPSPGADLMQKLVELRALDNEIEKPFTFPLLATNITRENWMDISSKFGAFLDPPPNEIGEINRHSIIQWRGKDESKEPISEAIEFWVDPDYEIIEGSFLAGYGRHNDNKVNLKITGEPISYEKNEEGIRHKTLSTLPNLYGRSGDLSVVFTHRYVSHGTVKFSVTSKLKDEAFQRWQYETWNAMHGAAQEQYYENRQILSERRERLAEELGQWDALTLRQMEREAIMKGVLRWLLGPDFEFGLPEADESTPSIVGGLMMYNAIVFGDSENDSLAVADISPTNANWERVVRYGEFIKFIHHAIEWENILYFTYPYFWDLPENWDFKLFLQHPDPRHREFLRAGSARVVLTIRPGYETEFTTLLETGELWQESDDEIPYLSIAEEIQNFARTNYPGVPPANPPDNYRTLLLPTQVKAWHDIQRFKILLEKHNEEQGNFPLDSNWIEAVKTVAQSIADDPTLTEAEKLDPWGKPWGRATIPDLDPWGNEWVYRYPGMYHDFDLATYGADGQPGGEGEDADITSWAEASLIGRWYEFTPTSALDISLNSIPDELA